jgi:hypothetical protein
MICFHDLQETSEIVTNLKTKLGLAVTSKLHSRRNYIKFSEFFLPFGSEYFVFQNE